MKNYLLLGMCICLVGCDMVSKIAEKAIEQRQSPVMIYEKETPLFLISDFLVREKNSTIPDFVNYPTDLAKYGLRGAVKSVVMNNKIPESMKFDCDGKLTYADTWLNKAHTWGVAMGLNYDEIGRLKYLYNVAQGFGGATIPDLSRYSNRYEYDTSGKLVSRDYGLYKKKYHYYDNGNLKSVDFVPVKENLGHYYGEDDTYFTCDKKGHIATMQRSTNHFLYGEGKLYSTFIHADNGLCVERNSTFVQRHTKNDSICTKDIYAYNEQGDIVAWTHESVVHPSMIKNLFNIYFDYVYDEQYNWVKRVATGELLKQLFEAHPIVGAPLKKAEDGKLRLEDQRTIVYYTDVEMDDYHKQQNQVNRN